MVRNVDNRSESFVQKIGRDFNELRGRCFQRRGQN